MQKWINSGSSWHKQFKWDDAACALAIKLWGEGQSATQIAGQLGGLSRSAVIGKLHRLGASGAAPSWKKRSNQNGVRKKRQRKPRPLRRQFADEAAKAAWLRAVAEDRAAIQSAPDLIVPANERKTLLDLEDNDCRWPHGDPKEPDFHFCNRKKVAGLPYCDFHAKRAYAPPAYRPRVIPRAMGQEAPIAVVSEFDAMERA